MQMQLWGAEGNSSRQHQRRADVILWVPGKGEGIVEAEEDSQRSGKNRINIYCASTGEDSKTTEGTAKASRALVGAVKRQTALPDFKSGVAG